MCTLIVFHRADPRVPLVVAANRDEYFARPASAPAISEHGGARMLAPRDLRAGGTWLGLGESGVFAALTNRPNPEPDPERRSRGWLVAEALAEPSAARAARALGALPRDAYNPFNLFVSDGQEAFVCVYQGTSSVTELAPGAHLIGNADPDDRAVPKVGRLLDASEAVLRGPREWWLSGLLGVLRGHEDEANPLTSACIHTEAYGTRSSSLLWIDQDPERCSFKHAEGPPCETDFHDCTHLLRELRNAPAARVEGAT